MSSNVNANIKTQGGGIPISEFQSSNQVAMRFGVSHGTIMRWFHGGLLPNAYPLGVRYFIYPPDIEALKERPQQQLQLLE